MSGEYWVGRESADCRSSATGGPRRCVEGLGHPAVAEEHVFVGQVIGKVGALLIGVGIGVGIGLLIAPASGEETRADLADKVSDFNGKVRECTGKKPQVATGTHGE
jgi:hypothetical protein